MQVWVHFDVALVLNLAQELVSRRQELPIMGQFGVAHEVYNPLVTWYLGKRKTLDHRFDCLLFSYIIF